MRGDNQTYPDEKSRSGEGDNDADGVQDWKGVCDKTGNEDGSDTPAKLASCPKNRRMLPSRLRAKPTIRLGGGQRVCNEGWTADHPTKP